MDHRSVVIRLAAEVRQILLATTVEVERRWQWLSLEERVSAVTDLVAVTLVYNRLFDDAAGSTDLLQQAVGKSLADTTSVADTPALAPEKGAADTFTLSDALTTVWDAFATLAEAPSISEAPALAFAQWRQDTALTQDATSLEPGKFFVDDGEDYVAPGYFADDYWAYTGPKVSDNAYLTPGLGRAEVLPVTDLLTSIRDFVRGFVDDAVMADAPTLSMDSQVADAVAPQDALALASAAAKSDSATTTDAAAIAFTALVQELVSSADALSFAAIKAVAETAVATDAPAKAFTATFLEVGGIYSAVDYFADDYVEAGTGPAVYDTFSYTLA